MLSLSHLWFSLLVFYVDLDENMKSQGEGVERES